MTHTTTPAELREKVRNMRAENSAASAQLDLIHSDIIGMDPVTFKHNGGNTDPDQVTTIRSGRLMVRCLAKNAAKTAAKLRSASRAPARMARRTVRTYPAFKPGMSTAQYINDFAHLNNGFDGVQLLPVDLSALMRPCTLYENGALDFDAIEEPIDAPETTPEAAPAEQLVTLVSAYTGATLGQVPASMAQAIMQRDTGATQSQLTDTVTAYTMHPARHGTSGAIVIKTPSPDGYRTRASRLAATFGKYSHRQGGYVVTAPGARRFAELYAAGWDGSYMSDKAKDRTPPTTQGADIADHQAAAAQSVADLVASATAAAVIEQASETTTEAHQAPELETVTAEGEELATTCEHASAGHGATLAHGSTSSTSTSAPQYQAINGKSGNWCARFRLLQDGSPVMEFSTRPHDWSVHIFSTGRERMAALQAMALQADDQAAAASSTEPAFAPITANELIRLAAAHGVTVDYVTCNGEIVSWAIVYRGPHRAKLETRFGTHWQLSGLMELDPSLSASNVQPGPLLEMFAALGNDTAPAGSIPATPADPAGYTPADQGDHQQSAPVPSVADNMPRDLAGVESLREAIRTNEREMDRVLKSKQQGAKDAAYRLELIIADLTNKLAAMLKSRPATPAPTEPAPTAPAGALSITITRAEGYADECGRPVTVYSFAAADDLLRAWSESAPASGGYDKCDFSITWPDGGTYEGRYDLKHHTAERPSLTAHMVDLAEFYTGANCPVHMTPARYAQHMESIDADTRAAYAEVLATLGALGAYFPKARPVSVDLRAFLAEGVAPDWFIGLGVTYCGDQANDAGTGAIVAAEPCRYAGLRVTVHLEDGRTMTATAANFGDDAGDRYRLDQKRHGAPYLAQLAGAVASRKASATAKKEIEASEHARQLLALAHDYPQLQRAGPNGAGSKLAAVNMRILLKAAFKGVKFSVTSERYTSARVRWTDGPTVDQVNAIIGRFDIGASDTYSDYFYTVSTAWSELFGGVQYLSVDRDESPALIERALCDLYPDASTRPSVADWQNARGAFDWRSECEHDRRAFRQHLASLSTWAAKA